MIAVIIGGLMLLVGAALTKAAFVLIDAPKNPTWIWVLASVVGLVAFFFIAEGTVLVLTGHWIPIVEWVTRGRP